DDSLAARHGGGQCIVGAKFDTAAQLQHSPVAHAAYVVRRCKSDVAGDQHDSAHMLYANVGHISVVDGIGALARHSDYDFLDFLPVDALLADEVVQRIEGRLDRRAHGPALDVGMHDVIRNTESMNQHRGIRLAAIGYEKIALAREHVVDARASTGDPRERVAP